MDNFLTNSKVLKELGLNEKNQWILYDEKAKKFFEYLAGNIDEENILTKTETEALEEIKAAGKFLEGDALTEELKTLETYFPGILSVTDESIEEMEQELKFLQADTKEREERIRRMEETQKQQLKEKEVLEKRNIELDYQVKMLAEESLDKAQKLEEHQKSNQKMILEFKQTFEPQNPPLLMYQMPLEQHFQKCDHFLGQLEIVMRKHFNITSSSGDVHDEGSSSSSIVEMKKRIHEIEKKKLEDGLTAAGMNHIIENIDTIRDRFCSDPQELRSLIDEIEAENENLSVELDVMHKEAEILVEQDVEHKIIKIFHEHCQEKHKRALDRLETIKSIQDVMEKVTMQCELLWVTMQLDLERFKNRVDNSDELAMQALDSVKRMRMMKMIANRNPVKSLNDFLLKKLQDLLIENLPVTRDELPSIASCLQAFVKFDENMQKMVKSSVAQENLSDLHALIKLIDCQSEQLKQFICSGPTNKPKLYDTKFLMEIYEKEQRKKELEKAFHDAKSNYKKNVVEHWENDKFFRMEKNLWIYFLTEPKKVLDCIKEVQKKAAEKGSATFKALNINISKAT